MEITQLLSSAIKEIITSLGGEVSSVSLEHPAELSHGDYSTNVALVCAKTLKENPKKLAEKIVDMLRQRFSDDAVAGIKKIDIAGPGFINFHFSESFFHQGVKSILSAKETFGGSAQGKDKRIIVEYSSPNIAKPFTVGHLRSTIIGDSIAKTYAALGYEVIRDNHLGDWGTQFGKQIVAIKKWGNEERISAAENPVMELVKLYVKFHEEAEKDPALEDEARYWFTELEKGNEEARRIWKKCVDWSLVEFNKIYAELGVVFDTQHGESFYEDKMPAVLKDLEEKKMLQESEGAKLVFFEGEKYPPLMIQKKDGSTLYGTRDLAAARFRRETYGKDILVVNEAGAEQSLYFKQLIETERMLGYFEPGQRVHVGHGFYRFKDGKMSTRKGNVIWLEEIIKEAVERAADINKETAHIVGIGAIKFNDLKRDAKQDIVFDWDEIVNLKGDSGPYLQYSYARAQSIIEKATIEKIFSSCEHAPESVSDLEKVIYRFPEVVVRAGREFAPHYIATYLMELSALYNNYYAHNKIVDKTDPLSPYRVALTEAFAVVIKNGLFLLGIEVPARM